MGMSILVLHVAEILELDLADPLRSRLHLFGIVALIHEGRLPVAPVLFSGGQAVIAGAPGPTSQSVEKSGLVHLTAAERVKSHVLPFCLLPRAHAGPLQGCRRC